MRKNLSETVIDWTEQAIRDFFTEHDEDVVYDVAFQAFPDDEGRFYGQVAIYIQIPGPTENTYVFGTSILRPFGLTQEIVSETVTQALTDAIAERERERSKSQTSET